MKIIKLTQGYFTLVDDEDYEYLSQFKWYVYFYKRRIYAKRGLWINGETIQLFMHRIILRVGNPKIQIDHRDHDGLNNCRDNLRIANQSQNSANKRKFKGTSKFSGVYWDKKLNKWRVRITKNYKGIHIGVFENEIEAAIAYDIAAKQLHGEFANLNFKNTLPHLHSH